MKKTLLVLMALLALILGSAATGDAHGFGHGHFHGGGRFGVDVVIGPGFGPWWGPYPYYGYPYPAAPVVVQQSAPIYVEPQQSQDQQYWYYCSDPSGYYPSVKSCPKGWMKVVPSAPPSAPEE